MRILLPFIQIWDVEAGAPGAVNSMSYSTEVTELARAKISRMPSLVIEGGAEVVVVGRVVVEVVG